MNPVMKKRILTGIVIMTLQHVLFAQSRFNLPPLQNRWQIQTDGSIFNPLHHLPYNDHIEMSGTRASLFLQYDVDATAHAHVKRTVVFPSFRMKPNDTHASMMYTFTSVDLPRLFIGKYPVRADIIDGNFYDNLNEKVRAIQHNGIMQVFGTIVIKHDDIVDSLSVTRKFFPSVDKPAALEIIVVTNEGATDVTVTMENLSRTIKTDSAKSFPSAHYILQSTINAGAAVLHPTDSVVYGIAYQASNHPATQPLDIKREETARLQRIHSFSNSLQLVTPDTILNTTFEFAKRRIGESVFETKAGPMMCPGGLRYYAAIWANDEAEYSNPFYPFTGDSLGNAAAVNSYMMFAKYMNDAYKPIPSSIIAAGDDYWDGAGDRGDQAMIAYGASRFALSYGNADTAKKLWPLIKWCLEFCKRKTNADGVIETDNDELEGRFPAGKANLNTSCLYYDALVSATKLAVLLNIPAQQVNGYKQDASSLRRSIEKYFGADMKGYKTYRYYKENTLLRSWICVPLTMGIFDRAHATIDALFSPALFSSEGFLTEEGSTTFWDRSTLYALRGIFAAGETERALAFLHYYSQHRLLGSHVPYPVEAYPEGNQRHLAAESGLYCRVFTEGVFGIRPTGFNSFECSPRLPKEWNNMALKNIRSFNNDFDIMVQRDKNKLRVEVNSRLGKKQVFTIKEGTTIAVRLF
jgi:hypothetical protein